MNVSPTQPIPVGYTISDPNDSTLYYVQAVVRDTQSSTVLQTKNLTQVSSSPNRYTGVLNPIGDASGLGRAVDITITVYTDSGYTTPSANYAVTQDPYLVIQPWLPTLGTGGVGFEYDKMAEIVGKVVDKKLGRSTKQINDRFGGVVTPKQISDSNDDLKTHYEGTTGNMMSEIRKIFEDHAASTKEVSDGYHKQFTEAVGRLGEVINALIGHSKEMSTSATTELTAAIVGLKQELVKAHQLTTKGTTGALDKMVPALEKAMKKILSDKDVHMHVHNHMDLVGGMKKEVDQTMP